MKNSVAYFLTNKIIAMMNLIRITSENVKMLRILLKVRKRDDVIVVYTYDQTHIVAKNTVEILVINIGFSDGFKFSHFQIFHFF